MDKTDKTDKLESGPGKLLGISGSYWQTCTLHAAVKLDVFTAIGNDKMTHREAAGKLSLDPRAVDMLLNALCAMALLEKIEDAYINTSESKTFLFWHVNRKSKRRQGNSDRTLWKIFLFRL